MQITTSWELKGRQQGQTSTILRQLNRKIGTVPEAITNQIQSLDSNQLDQLAEELLDFNTLDDLIEWLNHL